MSVLMADCGSEELEMRLGGMELFARQPGAVRPVMV